MYIQSEALLEEQFIKQLIKQGYEIINIPDETALEANFRIQLQRLNKQALFDRPLTDSEFNRILIDLKGKDLYRSAKLLREKYSLEREDGTRAYLRLINETEYHENKFQVINQINMKEKYDNRYDVTLLINGLPLIQIELKRRGEELKQAFNQIMRYNLHSMKGLFRFVQICVISNGVETKYFANVGRNLTYQQTFYWSDEKNVRLQELIQFSDSFLKQKRIISLITNYMIISETDKMILVMRPYQVYAVEELTRKVKDSESNGYIWHTTGSGKTLTSFKASQLISKIEDIKKVFFLVDRRDLDAQTITEFNKFSAINIERTDDTKSLVDQIGDTSVHLIVTTIQKMANAVKNRKYSSIFEKIANQRVVFIIDECHRSQFGEMYKQISSQFNSAQYFGFTGTPRFEENKSQDGRTTADIFSNCLHAYLIKDAIVDGNVLGFTVETMKTFTGQYDEDDDTLVSGIDCSEVFLNQTRIENVTKHIIKYHDIKSRNRKYNAIFTVPSIPILIEYYKMFKLHNDQNLKIAAIFTYGANEDLEGRDLHSRDELEYMIADYNTLYNTKFSTEDFSRYFTDVSNRVRKVEIDILLVVNMFLTGFDSKMLNTLYVDKNLRYHDLVQAYSRTNRIESANKTSGQIVAYRNLKQNTENAIRLFSQTDTTDVVLMDTLEAYIEQWTKVVSEFLKFVPTPESCVDLIDENDQLHFVKLFRELAKILVKLDTFIDFSFDESILGMSQQNYYDYRSHYYSIYEKTSKSAHDAVSILKDIDFVMELMYKEKIDVHYILNLLSEIDTSNVEQAQKEIELVLEKISKIEDPKLFKKIELIKSFLERVAPSITSDCSVMDLYDDYVQESKEQALKDFAKRIGLSKEKLGKYVDEFEYTGNIDIPMIDEDLTKELEIGLLQRKKARKDIADFIYEHVETYNY